ncbi:MAG: metalloregulator ArsR/SmtB family transcription factor [Nitriliruptoraceae bacterium]
MAATHSTDDATVTVAAAMKVLGEPRRLRLLRVLLQANDTLCGCELSDILRVPDYQISRDLSQLRKSGLVRDRGRSGTWVHYEAADDQDSHLAPLLDLLRQSKPDESDAQRLALRLALRDQVGCVLGPRHPAVVEAFRIAGLESHET